MTKFEEKKKEAYEKASMKSFGNTDGSKAMRNLLYEFENAGLLKPQQALPVVPECVAEWYEEHKDDLDYSIYSLCEEFDDTEPNREPTEFESWFDIVSNQPILTLVGMRNCYTVEKPQLFYLKHIDFCKTDKHYDWFTIKHSDGPLNHLRVEKGEKPSTIDCKFTQQEIDSMQTGSYEQIEVAE